MTGKLLEITQRTSDWAQVISWPPRIQDVTIFPGVFVSVCETLAQADQI